MDSSYCKEPYRIQCPISSHVGLLNSLRLFEEFPPFESWWEERPIRTASYKKSDFLASLDPGPGSWLGLHPSYVVSQALSQGWLAMAGVPGASNSQGAGGCSVGSNVQYQHRGQCWVGLY